MPENAIFRFDVTLIENKYVVACLEDASLGFVHHRRYAVPRRISYMLRRRFPGMAAFELEPDSRRGAALAFAVIKMGDVKAGLARLKELEAGLA